MSVALPFGGLQLPADGTTFQFWSVEFSCFPEAQSLARREEHHLRPKTHHSRGNRPKRLPESRKQPQLLLQAPSPKYIAFSRHRVQRLGKLTHCLCCLQILSSLWMLIEKVLAQPLPACNGPIKGRGCSADTTWLTADDCLRCAARASPLYPP
jgi:hypothetical protein